VTLKDLFEELRFRVRFPINRIDNRIGHSSPMAGRNEQLDESDNDLLIFS